MIYRFRELIHHFDKSLWLSLMKAPCSSEACDLLTKSFAKNRDQFDKRAVVSILQNIETIEDHVYRRKIARIVHAALLHQY